MNSRIGTDDPLENDQLINHLTHLVHSTLEILKPFKISKKNFNPYKIKQQSTVEGLTQCTILHRDPRTTWSADRQARVDARFLGSRWSWCGAVRLFNNFVGPRAPRSGLDQLALVRSSLMVHFTLKSSQFRSTHKLQIFAYDHKSKVRNKNHKVSIKVNIKALNLTFNMTFKLSTPFFDQSKVWINLT